MQGAGRLDRQGSIQRIQGDIPEPAHPPASFGVTDAAVYLLLAAVYLLCLVYVRINFSPLLVLVFVAVSTLGLVISLTLGWVLAKLNRYQEYIAALNRALTSAQTTNANLTTVAKVNEAKRETTQGERNAAMAKAKTTNQKNSKLQQHLCAANVTISDLRQSATENADKIILAEAGLHKEKAKHGATKKKVVALGQRLADTTSRCNSTAKELAATKEHLQDSKQAAGALRRGLKNTASKLDGVKTELQGTWKWLVEQKAKTAVLTTRLARATAEREATKTELAVKSKELTVQKTKTAVLEQSVEDITAERDASQTRLVAAIEEAAAKDAIIAHQRLEMSELRQLVAARGNANLVVRRILETTQIQLKDALFHLEVQQLSGKAMKAKTARLQEEVKSLQFSMLDLQLPTSASYHGNDGASSTKNDGSTGTLSATLSPSDTGSSSVSRNGSSGNMSNSDESGIVQPAVPAPPTPAPPSPSHAEASPVGFHAGPHDRPPRRREPKNVQKGRSSAKKTRRLQNGMSRGIPGTVPGTADKCDG